MPARVGRPRIRFTLRPAHPRSRTAFGLLAALITLAPLARARAAELPVYVSDEFKAVARRVFHQFVARQIEDACPKERPFCEAAVRELSVAFVAAVDGDEDQLRDGLSSFFVVATTSGLLEQTLGDLLPGGTRPIPEVSSALVPVAKCLSKLVAGQRVGKACDLTGAERQAALDALSAALPPGDRPYLEALRGALLDGGTSIDPVEVTRALAQVMAAPGIGRTDVAFYLDRLAAFLETGIEGGLFDPAMAFLANQAVTEEERAILDGDLGKFRLLGAPGDMAGLHEVLEACRQPARPLDDWLAAVKAPGFGDSLRRALVVEDSLALPLLRKVSQYACPATLDARGQVATLRSQALRLLGPLEVQPALRRHGLVALAGAALVDFARTGDHAALERSLRRTLLFGVAQVVRHAALVRSLERHELTSLTYLSIQDVMGSCELQRLSAALGEPYLAPRDAAAGCSSLLQPDATRARKTPFPSELASGLEVAAARPLPPALVDPGKLAPVALPGSAYAPALEAARRFVTLLLAERAKRGGEWREQGLLGTILDGADPAHPPDWKALGELFAALADRPADLEARRKLQEAAVRLAATEVKEGHETPRPAFLRGLLARLAVAGTPRQLRPDPAVPDAERRRRAALAAAELAESLVAQEAATASMRTTVRQVRRAVEALAQDRPAELQASLIRVGADFLAAQVEELAPRMVGGDYAGCDAMIRRRSIFHGPDAACAAQLLVRAAYQPVVDFVEQGARSAGVSKLADGVYRELMQSPALSTTPVIFNVGLGANLVAGPDRFVALTVLDKLGLAFQKVTDARWQFEHGPFVGGFLDALVRTATGEGKDRRAWLLGYTVGWPRMAGMDLGLELHAGAAMPFSSGSGKARFAAGGALVVPFSVVFDTK